MRINEGEIARLADVVVRSLLQQGWMKAKVDDKQLIARVSKLILDNLRAEEALEREAEQLAEKLSQKAAGMDQRKIIEGIKARLAKERGFTL